MTKKQEGRFLQAVPHLGYACDEDQESVYDRGLRACGCDDPRPSYLKFRLKNGQCHAFYFDPVINDFNF